MTETTVVQKDGRRRPRSEETKLKISLAQCGEKNHRYGKSPWNKGKVGIYSEETLEKNAEAHRGLTPWNKGKTGVQIYLPLSEETKQKISEARLGMTLSEEHRLNISKSKRGENHPNYGKSRSEETKRKISEGKFGEMNPAWKGGISFEPYCPQFNNPLREQYRNAYGRVCVNCGKLEILNGCRLSVHHCDGNKSQGCAGHDWFLVPLCRSCNSRGFERKPEYVFLFWLKDIERKHRRLN